MAVGVLHDDNGNLVDVPAVKIGVDAVRPGKEIFVWEGRR